MKTLLVITIIYSIFGWIQRHYKASKDKNYDINPFNSNPNIGSSVLVFCTMYSVVIGLFVILHECP